MNLQLLQKHAKFLIMWLKCSRNPLMSQRRHHRDFLPRPSTVTREMMMIPTTPRHTFLSKLAPMMALLLPILARPIFLLSVPHLPVMILRRTTDRRGIDYWLFLTWAEMFSLTTQVTCCIIHRLGSVTVLVMDVRSAAKWSVWLPPEPTDMFQTIVGCTSSGHYRQASNTAQKIAEEDTVNVYSSIKCDLFRCFISRFRRM